MRRTHRWSACALVLSLLMLAAPVHAGKADNVLHYASTKDIRDINPHLYAGEMAAQNMVFEPLVINTTNGTQPHLARRWDVSADGKTYTFELREDVRFSDGKPFDAHAVKANIDAVLANYERHAWLELVRQIDRVEVLGEHTVALHLKNPYYPTLTELGLTRPFRFVSPAAFVAGGTKDGVSDYAGTGPWVLAEHKRHQYARFERNPTYWGDAPALDGVQWHVIPDRQTLLLALQKEDVQLIFGADGDMLDIDSFTALTASGRLTAQMSEPVASRAIVLNSARPITGDRQVRQALQHSVDKEGIAQGIFNGSESVADTLMARNVPYADVDQPTYRYDLDQAAALLDAAGWTLTKGQTVRTRDGQSMTLMFSYNLSNAAEKEMAELIQDSLRRIGVDVALVGEEKQAFLDRQRSGDFDLQYSLSWGMPYDPASFVSSFRIPAHADYQGQKGLASKADIDALIGELLITPDDAHRQALYARLFVHLAEEAVYVPVTYSRTKVIHSQALGGVGFNPSQYEIPFENMYFK